MASLAGSLPMRLAAAYGLAAILVTVPVTGAATVAETGTLSTRAIAAVAAGAGGADGFVLDREGHIVHIAADGSVEWTATVDPYSTPFGTAVDGRAVFGGIRCGGDRCQNREAQLAVLDESGDVETLLSLDETEGWPTPLNGLALVGIDDDTVWINGGGTLFHVAVAPARILDRVPWPGGEPCVVDGVLYDLAASGGSYGRTGVDLSAAADVRFELQLRSWDGRRWSSVPAATTSMTYGQNAYCAPDGYDIRDGATTLARWAPGTAGWRASVLATSTVISSVTTGTRHRYTTTAEGHVFDVTRPERPRPTGVVIPGFGTSDMPPAVQVDDAGGSLFWCTTTYRNASRLTRCGSADGGPSAPTPNLTADTPSASGVETHQYNLCSAACGPGVRPHTRDVVVWLANQHRPAALSLNEHCYDDHVHLASHLPVDFDAGAAYTALGTATACPGAVKHFGNQVWVRSGGEAVPTTWAQFPTQVTSPCDHTVNECRGMACAATTAVFCSAHLESSRRGPGIAEAQAREYRDLVSDGFGRDLPQALAGDFNHEREDVDVLLAASGHQAATTGPTVGTKQIDMVYFDDRHSSATTYCDLQASDHCYVMADAITAGA